MYSYLWVLCNNNAPLALPGPPPWRPTLFSSSLLSSWLRSWRTPYVSGLRSVFSSSSRICLPYSINVSGHIIKEEILARLLSTFLLLATLHRDQLVIIHKFLCGLFSNGKLTWEAAILSPLNRVCLNSQIPSSSVYKFLRLLNWFAIMNIPFHTPTQGSSTSTRISHIAWNFYYMSSSKQTIHIP